MQKTQAFTLKTYPFREADRVTIFFSEEFGIVRGVARGSLKMKSKVSGALEPLTLVNLRFVEPHGRDLVVVTGCDAVRSLYHHFSDLFFSAAVGVIAEITLESHADRDPNQPYFRLLELAQRALKEDISPGIVMHYFELFSLKLTGVLPPLSEIRSKAVKDLMKKMLQTNLFDIGTVEKNALRNLGRYMKKQTQNSIGKQLKSYDFMEQFLSEAE